jgi:hypothetical protein
MGSEEMKRLLFIVRGYFPDISASGNLLKPLVEELAKENFVFVLSCSSKPAEGEFSSNLKFKKIKIDKTKKSFLFKVFNLIWKNFSLSLYDKKIYSPVKKELERLDEEYHFDQIIAVTYEETLALLDSNIEPKKKNVFLLEKLPTTSTVKIPLIYKYKAHFKKNIENRIINSFNKIYTLPVMFNYFKNQMDQRNINNVIELEHPMITNRVQLKSINNEKVKLIYAGGLDRKQRNPISVLNFLKEVNQQYKIETHFYSYGNMQNKLCEFSSKNEFFQANSGISSDLLNEKMLNSDFIITIGNKERDLVPSKIFDCISTGKPIIHFSQINQDPYIKYLDKYQNSIVINMNELTLDATIKKVILFLKNRRGKIIEFDQIRKSFEVCTPEFVGKKMQKSL